MLKKRKLNLRRKIFLLSVALAPLGVCGGFIVFLTTEKGSDWLLEQSMKLLGLVLPNASIEVENLETNLIRGLDLDGLRLLDDNGEELIAINKINVEWRLEELLAGKVHLNSVKIQDLSVDAKLVDGELNIIKALGIESDEESSSGPFNGLPVDIYIDSISLTGELTYDHTWTAQDLTLEGSFEIVENTMIIKLEELYAMVGQHELLPFDARGTINLIGDDLSVRGVEIGLGESVLGASAFLGGLHTKKEVQTEIWLENLNLEDLRPLTGDLGVNAEISSQISIEGSFEALQAKGIIKTNHGNIRAGVGVNLNSKAWDLRVALDQIKVDQLVEALPSEYPITLEGLVNAHGNTMEEAEISLEISALALGFQVQNINGELSLAREGLGIRDLLVISEFGQIQIQGGVGLDSASLSLDVNKFRLAELHRFGVTGFNGFASLSGDLELAFANGINGQFDGSFAGSGINYPYFALNKANGPIKIGFNESALNVTGSGLVKGLSSYGTQIETVDISNFDVDVALDTGLFSWNAEGQAHYTEYESVLIEQADFVADGNGADVVVKLDASGLHIPTRPLDNAIINLTLMGPKLDLVLDGVADQKKVLEVSLNYELDSGEVAIPRLALVLKNRKWEAQQGVMLKITPDGVESIDAILASETAKIAIKGDINLKGPVDIALKADNFDLDLISPFLPDSVPNINGMANLDLNITGDINNGLIPVGKAIIKNIDVEGYVTGINAEANVFSQSESIGFDLNLFTKEPLLKVKGEIPLRLSTDPIVLMDNPWNATIELLQGSTTRWNQILEYEIPEFEMNSLISLGGTPRDIRLNLEGKVDFQDLGASVIFGLEQEGDKISLNANAFEEDQQRVLVSGEAKTGIVHIMSTLLEKGELADTPWIEKMSISTVPIGLSTQTIFKLGNLPEIVEGELVGGVEIQGNLDSLQILGGLGLADSRMGDFLLVPAQISLVPSEGGYFLDFQLGFEPEGLHLGTVGDLSVSGFLPLTVDLLGEELVQTSGEIDLKISGSGIPLAAIASFAGDLQDSSGVINIEGQIKGTYLKPLVNLNLNLENGNLVYPYLGIKYEDINLTAYVKDNLFQLKKCQISSKPYDRQRQPGELSAKGQAKIEGLSIKEIDFTFGFNRFWIIDNKMGRLAINGDITATNPKNIRQKEKDSASLLLQGNIDLVEGKIVADESFFTGSAELELDPRITVTKFEGQAVKSLKPNYLEEKLLVDLDINLNKAAWIEARMPLDDTYGAIYAALATLGLEAQLDGDINIQFGDNKLALGGELTIPRGRAEILNAGFELDEGVVSFVGEDPFNPFLDIKAKHNTGQYGVISVLITGTVEDLGLEFSSDSYDDTDVVSILVLGRPLSELSNEEGQSNSELLSLLSQTVMGELERMSGGMLDMFQIDSDSIRVGHSIAPNLFLIVAVQPNADIDQGENLTEATIEWTISHMWTLEAVTGDRGASSVDLYWTRRF